VSALVRLAWAAFLCAGSAHAAGLPSFAEFKAQHRPSDVTLTDRHGVPVQTLRIDKTVRRLPWLALQDLSPALLQAVVLSEDRAFYEHSGVDWGAVARSAWGNVWNTRTRGASTLTMQLAGLMDADLARPASGRSAAQKLTQAFVATRLDARWKKSEILEAYLNSVPFRGEVVGINALAQTLFGKHASGLDAQEAAVAAALLRAPNAAAPAVAQRACGVLTAQRLPCAGVAALAENALLRQGGMPLGEQLAPHFARQVAVAAAQAPGGTLRTTLDAGLQRAAITTLRTQLAELSGRHVEDGAVLVLDRASGEVLAWVGSSGALSAAAQVDGVVARRQPGSTLKPFVYALGFERGYITPATLLDDSPAQVATGSGLYLPQNYDRRFKGWVSARAALASSLNVPAVRVGGMLGADALWSRLNDFGLALPESGGYFGASLALGSADVTLLALTNAYRALGNGGLFTPVKMPNAAAVPPRRVATATASFIVGDILSDNEARALTFGFDSALATRGWAAVKTGTSKDMRDNWCIGWTDRYAIGVWVGNASGEPMQQVSGTSGAAPVWRALVAHLHAASPSRPPAVPAGVVHVAQAGRSGPGLAGEPARAEWFIAGTQPAAPSGRAADAAAQRVQGAFGITQPRDGSLFALDPDIPPAAQRVRFEGEAGVWVLDGKRLGQGASLHWAPWPGRHELSLLAPDGRTVQTVRFEVRGAGVRAPVQRSAQRPMNRPAMPADNAARNLPVPEAAKRPVGA